MSLRKRRFIGELTKKDLTKKLVAGGFIISLLLAAWMFLPTFIDYIFGGSRGNYNTHHDLPTEHENYDLFTIPYEPNLVFDPTLFDPAMLTPELLEMLRDLLDPQNMDIPNDFSGFNLSNFDLPLFYINDIGVAGDYTEAMRQNAYDAISADGTSWSRSSSNLAPINPGTYVMWGSPGSFREVTFIFNATATIDLRLPMFSYTAQYLGGSMRYTGSSGTFYIPDDDVLFNDTYEVIEAHAYGLPAYADATNFTYGIVHDYQMTMTQENNYKTGVYPSDVPTTLTYDAYANYLQIPGVDSLRDLMPYLNTHPRFAATYANLTSVFNKATSPTNEILNGIVAYLYANYDVFTSFPERPGDGQDMIEWFLSRPKTTYPDASGTPYDFAAAFTMLARAFDIPARMVTGYYDWDGDGIVTLSNVYAWAEALLPQVSSELPWINYDFVPQFNSSQMLPLLPDTIWIDNPAMGETFNTTTGIPLNLRMYSNATITDITYSIDGGANQTLFGMQQPLPGYTGAYYLNHTFDVGSPGVHTVRAFLHTTSGVVGSITNNFLVNQDAGYFISVSSPANNSVTNSSTIVLDYTAVNSSTITGVSFSVIDVNTGTPVVLNSYIAPMASQVTAFTLATNGTFDLVVTILTELGGFTSLSTLGHVYFSVNPPDLLPDAWFFPVASTVVQGQPLLFVHPGSDGNTIADFQWNFGDGTINATMENPVHYFSTPGVYNVTLTITDADGDVDTVTRPYVVTVTPNELPDPLIAVNATHIQPGWSVQFTHLGSPGDLPYNRSWDFGDGATAGNLTTVVHQYTDEGNYTAVFSITDGNGDTNTSSVIIYVSWDLYPDAAFTVNGSYVSQFISSGDNIQFTHVGSNGDLPAEWQWNFGDGSPNATVENPLHQYTSSGSRTVTLTVIDNDGDRDVYRWIGCINVDVLATNIDVDFTPKDVEIFQDITISGNLEYTNGTGIGGQTINLRVEYWLGSTLQGFNTTIAVTVAGTGYYSATLQVLTSSDFIRVIATFAGTSVLLSSTAQVIG